jgi:predicted DNA-binding protein with PD1-like motif
MEMRTITQPGVGPSERVQWIEAKGLHVSARLEPGLPLLDAVWSVFAAQGLTSGVLRLEGGAFAPFAYVIPALPETPRHAAYYSATLRPPGLSRIRTGALTFGYRDGMPFFHCHAFWTDADGILRGGHVMPEETFVAEPIQVIGIGLDGAAYTAEPDPETNFTLFGPVSEGTLGLAGERRVFALRLRPNQDLSQALEAFCREQKISRAWVHGGVGSTIGARYEDGRAVDAFATELAIHSGRIAPGERGEPEAELDIALVDYTGAVSEGRLTRGDNPVLMTVEVALEVCN